MTKADLEKFRQQLLALGQRLKGNVSGLQGEAFRNAGGEASGGLSNAPLHPADLGTDNYEEEITLDLLENEEQRLEEISVALRRIDQGTFGRCEECGKVISKPRLEALPYTRHCVACARRLQG